MIKGRLEYFVIFTIIVSIIVIYASWAYENYLHDKEIEADFNREIAELRSG